MAGYTAGYQAGVTAGKAQAAQERRAAAPTISVERDEFGRPRRITEQAADGTIIVKTVQLDDAGRIIRLVSATEA